MATQERYQEWTNYETWVVALWMTNEQGSYNAARDSALQALADARMDLDKARQALAAAVKKDYETSMCEILDRAQTTCSVWADLLGAALSEVNWHEIASQLVDEVYAEDMADAT